MPEVVKMEKMNEREKEELKEDLLEPRRMYLLKRDFEEKGCTSKCLGRKALLKGTKAANSTNTTKTMKTIIFVLGKQAYTFFL